MLMLMVTCHMQSGYAHVRLTGFPVYVIYVDVCMCVCMYVCMYVDIDIVN